MNLQKNISHLSNRSPLLQNGRLPFSNLEYLVAWLYREGICSYLFVKASLDPTVKWRNGRYRLLWGGLAQEILEPHKPPAAASAQLDPEKNNHSSLSLASLDRTTTRDR